MSHYKEKTGGRVPSKEKGKGRIVVDILYRHTCLVSALESKFQ